MTLPIIHIKDIPEDGLEVESDLDATWLSAALEGTEFTPDGDPSGRVEARLDLHERDVTLTGTVDARLRAECVRCLASTTIELHVPFALHLQPAGPIAGGVKHEIELSTDDLDADTYSNDRVDLGHWVREQILVEAPAHPQCADECVEPVRAPESTNAAPVREIDPRLAPLKHLVTKKE